MIDLDLLPGLDRDNMVSITMYPMNAEYKIVEELTPVTATTTECLLFAILYIFFLGGYLTCHLLENANFSHI